MDRENSDGPFKYLQTVGKRAIAIAREFQQEDLRRVESHEINDRLTIVARRLGDDLHYHSQTSVVILRSLLFTDSNTLARGLTLIAAANAARSRHSREAILANYSSLLSQQYAISHSEVVVRLTNNWLDALIDIATESFIEDDSSRAVMPPQPTEHPESLQLDRLNSNKPVDILDLVRAFPKDSPHQELLVIKCRDILADHSDLPIAMLAIREIIRLASPEDRIDVCPDLVRLVMDTTATIELRDVAYQALFELADEPVHLWPEVRRTVGNFIFPDDIDLTFLNRMSGLVK